MKANTIYQRFGKIGLSLLAVLFSYSSFAQNEIPNAGFENWNGTELIGWSHNSVPGLAPVVQSSDAYSGNFAVRGEVLDLAGNAIPPSLFTGTGFEPRFPVSASYQTLNGFYKYEPQGGDTLLIQVVFSNETLCCGAEGNLKVAAGTGSYTEFEIPIVYDDDNVPGWVPTHANITVVILPPTGGIPHIGTYYQLDHFTFDNSPLSIGEETNNGVPGGFELRRNYPNPFNPSTTFEFTLPKASAVQLVVFDQLGREVARILDEHRSAGTHAVQWNAAAKIPSGVYIYRLSAGEFRATGKMTLTK